MKDIIIKNDEYREIGTGCERLIRQIFMDNLKLNESDVKWSYQIENLNGKKGTLYLDARIVIKDVKNKSAAQRLHNWKLTASSLLGIPAPVADVIKGLVFEIRQGYKSKDSKRQNADIANASNAYANGYLPCLMVMSSQIDEDIVNRYRQAKWLILKGLTNTSEYSFTFDFCKEVIGFDLAAFMCDNQEYFRCEILSVLDALMRAE